ncbi:Uncharacterised protein [uncultured archaeon]|nr:Uncharacterised protein [uncultured archaeon]
MEWVKNWFSNMLPADKALVDEMGIQYHSTENYYQAAKMPDRERRIKIANMSSRDSKRAVRTKEFRITPEQWAEFETRKLQVMEDALRQKFAPGTSWYAQLVATGDEEIVEWNNWNDRYWGKTLDGVGENNLGKLLMKIRADLKVGSTCP